MSTSYRQWLTLRMIPRHPRKIDTATIEDRLKSQGFNVHRRTIQRDLESFSETFPLLCDDRDKPYGWSWSPDAAAFDIPQMDPTTALTFRMADRFLASLMPPATLDLLQPYIRHASRVLDDIDRKHLQAWPDKVRILSRSQPLAPPDIDPHVLAIVYESLLEGKRFSVVYRRRGELDPVEYTVNPLGIVMLDAVSYLVCTMRDYNQLKDVRQLSLHRMLAAQRLEEPGIVPEAFSLHKYIDSGAFTYLRGEESIRLKALFEKDAALHLGETPLGENQVLTEIDNETVQLETTIPDTAQLRWWLLGFGGRVEVMEPVALRDDFRTQAKQMMKWYGED
jgi:predicted DNA-binding transcriptional regulator YafY